MRHAEGEPETPAAASLSLGELLRVGPRWIVVLAALLAVLSTTTAIVCTLEL
jgi:hypothetical protein